MKIRPGPRRATTDADCAASGAPAQDARATTPSAPAPPPAPDARAAVFDKLAPHLDAVRDHRGLTADELPAFLDETAGLPPAERKVARALLIEAKRDAGADAPRRRLRNSTPKALVAAAAAADTPTTSKQAQAQLDDVAARIASLRAERRDARASGASTAAVDDALSALRAQAALLGDLHARLRDVEAQSALRNTGVAGHVGLSVSAGFGSISGAVGFRLAPRDDESARRRFQPFVSGQASIGPRQKGGTKGGDATGPEDAWHLGPVGISNHPVYGREKSLGLPIVGGVAVNDEDGVRGSINLPVPFAPFLYPLLKTSVSVQLTDPHLHGATDVVGRASDKVAAKAAPLAARVKRRAQDDD